MNLELIRDLAYKDNDSLLHAWYDLMKRTERQGTYIDPLLFEFIENHFLKKAPKWLLGIEGNVLRNPKVIKNIFSYDEHILDMAQMLCENYDTVGWSPHCKSTDCLDLDIEIKTELLVLRAKFSHREISFWIGYDYLGSYESRFTMFDGGGETNQTRIFGSRKKFFLYLNHVLGYDGFFDEEGVHIPREEE